MRTLEKNKVDMWYVNPTTETQVVDVNGDYTGEKELNYSIPTSIRLHLYPSTGEVVLKTFGKEINVDMVSVSNIELEKNTLLFFTEPTEKFDTTYDYNVTAILKSLNNYQYGLKGRI